MISFGRLYISNPDLAERLIEGKELNTNWDMKTFFGTEHGVNGYIDYPRYDELSKNK
jgi:N-ethylmaleimide reductase